MTTKHNDTTSELRQDLEDFAAHYADYRQGIYDSNHEELDKRITILMRRIAAQKQRWEAINEKTIRKAVRSAILKDPNDFMSITGDMGIYDIESRVVAGLRAALDGVIGEPEASAEQLGEL